MKRLSLFLFGMLLGQALTAAPDTCKQYYQTPLSGKYLLTFEDIVKMSIEIETMPSSPDKSATFGEFKAKYKDLQRRLGFNIKILFENRLAQQRVTQKEDQHQKKIAKDKRKREEENQFKFARTKKINFKSDSPEKAIFYNDSIIIFPQRNEVVFWDIIRDKKIFSQSLPSTLPDNAVVLSEDKSTLYVIGKTTYKISLDRSTAPDSWLTLPIESSPNMAVKDGTLKSVSPETGKISSDGKYLLQAGSGSYFSVRDAHTLQELYSHYPGVNTTGSIEFSQSGRFVLANSDSGYHTLLDLHTMKTVEEFKEKTEYHEKHWNDGQFLADSDTIIYITENGAIKTYDPHSKTYQDIFSKFKNSEINENNQGITLTISDDGTKALVTGEKGIGNGVSAFSVIDIVKKEELTIPSAPQDWEGNTMVAPKKDNRVAYINRYTKDKGFTDFTIFDFESLSFRTHTLAMRLWTVSSWIRPTGLFSPDNGAIILAAENVYQKEIVYVY